MRGEPHILARTFLASGKMVHKHPNPRPVCLTIKW